MDNIKKALREIEYTLRRVDIFLIVLKTLAILMISYLFLYILGVRAYYAFLPSFVYFVSSIFVEARVDNVKRVERGYTNLNEKLITARDYQDQDNAVLNALEQEIVRDLDKVTASSFFSYRKTLILIFILMLAVSSSLYISSKNIKILDFNRIVNDAIKRFEKSNEQMHEPEFEQAEASIMEVGDEKIEVKINPVGIDFDFNEVKDEADYEFAASFPEDIFISSGSAYEEEFTEEQQILIKRYFDKMKLSG